METLIERLWKIEALAHGGSEGERENARHLLAALCRKYGLTLEQIADQKKSWHAFPVRGEWERKLFGIVIVHVLQTHSIRHMKSSKGYECELTIAQAIDVRDCWEHFRKAWRAQLDDFFVAFVHKNRIFGTSDGFQKEPDQETKDAAQRIFDLMRGMEARPWEKRLYLAS